MFAGFVTPNDIINLLYSDLIDTYSDYFMIDNNHKVKIQLVWDSTISAFGRTYKLSLKYVEFKDLYEYPYDICSGISITLFNKAKIDEYLNLIKKSLTIFKEPKINLPKYINGNEFDKIVTKFRFLNNI